MNMFFFGQLTPMCPHQGAAHSGYVQPPHSYHNAQPLSELEKKLPYTKRQRILATLLPQQWHIEYSQFSQLNSE